MQCGEVAEGQKRINELQTKLKDTSSELDELLGLIKAKDGTIAKLEVLEHRQTNKL